MADDRFRNLRRLAKKYGITFKLHSDEFPVAHLTTFRNVRKLARQKFDSYEESVSIRSSDEPWTEQIKHRAEWLARRASNLSRQQRNEAGWRFGLENDVLRRFSVEVACPKCRARVWRSEIEATLNESSNLARNLERRKTNRIRCQCPPDSRPQDYYEIGTNPLFDDRVQEMIYHDLTLRSELPKQEPDRVYGLQATRNFKELLSRSKPCKSTSNGRYPRTIGDEIRSSPFREKSDPLLFPFLVLEAKSGSSRDMFPDIETQTAFPIWSLLRLQEDLKSYQISPGSSFEPLVWFLATRGSEWRVYGCYITKGANNRPTTYDVHPLWVGFISDMDNAIQLVLIVDYILDWARDIYRPSILRHLKSIATGKPYDEISLTQDSDVFSMQGNISRWIPDPPNTTIKSEVYKNLGQLESLGVHIPKTKLGSIRSAAVTEFLFNSLHITKINVESFLVLTGEKSRDAGDRMENARELIHLITRLDKVLLLTSTDLDQLEYIWTGTTRSRGVVKSSDLNEKFYVLLEFRCYVSFSWEITKEITCLAVSRLAFEILIDYTGFRGKHSTAESPLGTVRPCQMAVLRESVECLKSGSPRQVLRCALSCLLISLCLKPERKPADCAHQVDSLDFRYGSFPRVKPFIQKCLAIKHSNSDHRTKDTPFQRVSAKKARNCRGAHYWEKCSRCYRGNSGDLFATIHNKIAPSSLSTYGAILVESPNGQDSETITRHDLCLFVVEESTFLNGKKALPLIIEDIHGTKLLYHTIKHSSCEDPAVPKALTWNITHSSAPPSEQESIHIMNWCQELMGKPVVMISQQKDIWCYNQMLLHFIELGHSYIGANVAVVKFCRKFPDTLQEKCQAWKEAERDWTLANPGRRVALHDFFKWIDKEAWADRKPRVVKRSIPPL